MRVAEAEGEGGEGGGLDGGDEGGSGRVGVEGGVAQAPG